ncbi:hypothetical protein [Lysobacter sp. FW306-1B-D06B]|uniref:hypothetical protein n=1 Tax=Lysobacter sp. FW306-1B-D06B TaxID=3140250 RepID=UPI00313FEA5C
MQRADSSSVAPFRMPYIHGKTILPSLLEAMARDPTLDEAQITVAMTQVDQIWAQLFPAEQQRLVRLLIERVVVSPTAWTCACARVVCGGLAAEFRPTA